MCLSGELLRLQINPDAGNLGAKVGFIFFGTGLVAAIGGWFLYPETKVGGPNPKPETI